MFSFHALHKSINKFCEIEVMQEQNMLSDKEYKI
jgi:hypothetical protein